MEKHSIHPLCKWSITRSWKPANVPPKLVPELRNCTTLYTVLRNGIRTGVMVLDCPCSFGRPWNAAENSQRQTCKLSHTLSESAARDGLRLVSGTSGITANRKLARNGVRGNIDLTLKWCVRLSPVPLKRKMEPDHRSNLPLFAPAYFC